MELANIAYRTWADEETLPLTLSLMTAPFAPHLSEEVWVEVLGQPFSVHKADWPKYDDDTSIVRSGERDCSSQRKSKGDTGSRSEIAGSE